MSREYVFEQRRLRLLEMLGFIRSKSLVRAHELAAHFQVTERTVYRDISTLIDAGAPIEGQSGVGYIFRPNRAPMSRLNTPTRLKELLTA